MSGENLSDILVAIGKLQEKTEHIENYIYKDLKPYMESNAKRCQWAIGIMLTIFIVSIGVMKVGLI